MDKKKYLFYSKAALAASIVFFIAFMYFFLTNEPVAGPKNTVEAEIFQAEKDYQYEIIADDIESYGYSRRYAHIVKKAIESASEKYGVPPALLHAIMRVESDYRLNAQHDQVTIKVKDKTITTRAVGIAGIIWEFWSDSLKARNIAEDKMDLYLPDVAINASGYILRVIIDQELKRNVGEEALINRIITRYYGAYSQSYKEKMMIVTSDLWLKRVVKDIINRRLEYDASKQNSNAIDTTGTRGGQLHLDAQRGDA
jgi:hypothetical protein